MTAAKRKYRQKQRRPLLCAVSSLTLLPKNNFSSSERRLTHLDSLIQLLFFSTHNITHKNVLHHLCGVCCTWHKKVERSCFMKTVACSSGSHETQFSLNIINIVPIMNSRKVHVTQNGSRLIVRRDIGLRETYAGYSFRKWTSGKIRVALMSLMSGFMAVLYHLYKQKMRLSLTYSSFYAAQWVVSAALLTHSGCTQGSKILPWCNPFHFAEEAP